ncbi:hypothetical protein [Kitasatospora sp. NBC_00315]|uniref:hypothetical protein n=1 Tax=Kitasatospora sp. NBC_00315 TaxID=2975963 RepID=UPI0032504662
MVGAADTATALLDTAAAPSTTPGPVQGVIALVALSAPRKSGGWDAVRYAERALLPTFFAADKDDRTAAADAKALYDASAHAAPGKLLRIYPGAHHGADVLGDGALPDLLDFLAARTPATPTPTEGAA